MAPDHSFHYLLLAGYGLLAVVYVVRRYSGGNWLRPFAGLFLAGIMVAGHLGAHNALADGPGAGSLHAEHQQHPCCLFQVPLDSPAPDGLTTVRQYEILSTIGIGDPGIGYIGDLQGRSPPIG